MLLNTLKTEPMYALNERITRRVALTPLSAAEVESYIYHRLAIAGGADAVSFQPDAMRLIADLSRGLPRRINVLCDRTLQEGRLISATAITGDIVKRAAKSLAGVHPAQAPHEEADAISLDLTAISSGDEGPRSSGRVLRMAGAAVIILLLAAGGAYWFFGSSWLNGEETFALPKRAQVPTLEPAPKMTIPTDAELETYFRDVLRFLNGGGD
jgi:general secretion pathway protein A